MNDSILLEEIKLLQKKRVVYLLFNNHHAFEISCYQLRIHSPSAEMRGHQTSASPEKIAAVDKDVNITDIEPIGHYAVKFVFDDGHQTGLYHWAYLYELCQAYGTDVF